MNFVNFYPNKVQTNGKYSDSLDKANRLMTFTNKQPDNVITDKKSLISNIHSNIGNAYLELGKYDLALQAHQRDLEISKEM